jgi:hypothetical protein
LIVRRRSSIGSGRYRTERFARFRTLKTRELFDEPEETFYDSITINLSTNMSNVTIENIAALLKSELEPINTRLAAVEETLSGHTTALSNIAGDVKSLLDQKTITDHRLERLEHWAQIVGQKFGVKIKL